MRLGYSPEHSVVSEKTHTLTKEIGNSMRAGLGGGGGVETQRPKNLKESIEAKVEFPEGWGGVGGGGDPFPWGRYRCF